jgi:CheY-like chemotaxis protein
MNCIWRCPACGMPGMDGYEVVREFRKRDETKSIPIVALNGYGQPEESVGRDARAKSFALPPINLNESIGTSTTTDPNLLCN